MMDITELVLMNAAWIRNAAGRFYDDERDAEDLAGETIYRILNNADKFNPGMSFKPWALVIMKNEYRQQYNRRKCVHFKRFRAYDIYESLDHADQRVSVRKILSLIHDSARRNLNMESVLLYARGFSYLEIASIVGVPIGTVKSRISIGRKMLRRILR